MKRHEIPMRQAIMERLPPHTAKHWKSALALKRSDPRLDSRSLYSTLNWMYLRGLVEKRPNAETGLAEYARKSAAALKAAGYGQ